MIRIAIYLGTKEHGARNWPAVPRIGEKIAVKVGDKVQQLKVSDVIWGITEESRTGFRGECEVAVVCSPKRGGH